MTDKITIFWFRRDLRLEDNCGLYHAHREDCPVQAVWANRDYEPYAGARDREVSQYLEGKGIPFRTVKEHTIFGENEILKKDGAPYLVYTPYSKAWKKKLTGELLEPYPSETQTNWLKTGIKPFPGLQQLGFEPAGIEFPPREPDETGPGPDPLQRSLYLGTDTVRRFLPGVDYRGTDLNMPPACCKRGSVPFETLTNLGHP